MNKRKGFRTPVIPPGRAASLRDMETQSNAKRTIREKEKMSGSRSFYYT
jgi:hypothetical protein